MQSMLSGLIEASSKALLMAILAPSPLGCVSVILYASAEEPYPKSSPNIGIPLDMACSNSSKITTPAPSDNTNPFLLLSKGLDAV